MRIRRLFLGCGYGTPYLAVSLWLKCGYLTRRTKQLVIVLVPTGKTGKVDSILTGVEKLVSILLRLWIKHARSRRAAMSLAAHSVGIKIRRYGHAIRIKMRPSKERRIGKTSSKYLLFPPYRCWRLGRDTAVHAVGAGIRAAPLPSRKALQLVLPYATSALWRLLQSSSPTDRQIPFQAYRESSSRKALSSACNRPW